MINSRPILSFVPQAVCLSWMLKLAHYPLNLLRPLLKLFRSCILLLDFQQGSSYMVLSLDLNIWVDKLSVFYVLNLRSLVGWNFLANISSKHLFRQFFWLCWTTKWIDSRLYTRIWISILHLIGRSSIPCEALLC